MNVVAVFSYDCGKDSFEGRRLKMIHKSISEASMKKLFKQILSRREYFGVYENIALDDFCHAYFQGGIDAVNKLMRDGALELIEFDEWID